MKYNLYNYTFDELAELMKKIGWEKYRAKQVFDWIYKNGVMSIDEMKNLPKNLIATLKSDFTLFLPVIEKETKSKIDGTSKYLLRLKDNARIECVLIFDGDRITLCASTQVGCACGCEFCATATLGFKRNLGTDEIISQVMLAWKKTGNKLKNIVFMGMGEPLLNWENLHRAILIISDKKGFNFSQKRITVSTAGIVPIIKEIANSGLHINLAISLITADDELRSKIMPLNKKYPLKEIIKAAKYYNKKTGKQITIEYVVFKGLNDKKKDAEKLVEKLRGVNFKINLIPYNSSIKQIFERPPRNNVLEFQKVLMGHNIKVFIRKEKGADIKAACGQLVAETDENFIK